MLLETLDSLYCPRCNSADRLWKIDGDTSTRRVADAKIICPNEHVWQVREEILRLDKEAAEEEMIFLGHDLTGYPKEVGEMERGLFFESFAKYCYDISSEPGLLIKVTGSPILFFRYLDPFDGNLVAIHSNEGILRQLQVMAVRKQLYSKISFIRHVDANFIQKTKEYRIFGKMEDLSSLKPGDVLLSFVSNDTEVNGSVIWTGETNKLVEFIA